MKIIQKYVIVLSGLTVFLFLGYIAIQHPDSSQLDGIQTNTSMSQSGIETDTIKRLETATSSESNWGMSPFGSGKPLEVEKLEFKKPNTEWKTRTLSGITYVFGEGNPKEVALDENGIQKMADTCGDMPPSIDIRSTNKKAEMLWNNGFCNSENDRPRYLSKQVEYHLLMALGSSDWQNLYEKCEANIRFGNSLHSGSSDSYLTFDQVFFSGILDINNFILINPETGWKQLDIALTKNLLNYILDSQLLIGQGEVITNPYGDCVDQYGANIKEHLGQALYIYGIPL